MRKIERKYNKKHAAQNFLDAGYFNIISIVLFRYERAGPTNKELY